MISKSFLGLIPELNGGLRAEGTSQRGQVENGRTLPATFPFLRQSMAAPKVSSHPTANRKEGAG